MSLANWSTTPASNNSAPPNGAPENTTLLGDLNDIIRQMMADVRTLAASDTIASATTCDLGSKDSTFLTVSGTTTITGLGTVSAGIYKFVTFSGALTLTHNATSLILPGAVNITTVAGDTALFLSLGSGNWKCMYYQNAYATGSWTPSLVFGSDAASGASTGWTTSASGTYVKIGKLVHVNGQISLSATGSSTGSAWINGLPFTSAAAPQAFLDISADYLTYSGQVCMALGTSGTYMYVTNSASASATSIVQHSAFSSNTILRFSGTYIAAS